MTLNYYPTGNDYVALPTINQFADIESFNVLSMSDRGLLEVTGKPFLTIDMLVGEQVVDKSTLEWRVTDHWIPTCTARHGDSEIELSFVAPRDSRGWLLRIRTLANLQEPVTLRLTGDFGTLQHSINETKPCRGDILGYNSLWNDGLMFDFRTDITKLSFGFLTEDGFSQQRLHDVPGRFTLEKVVGSQPTRRNGEAVHYIYMGVGLDEVSAATQAVHMRRVGGEALYDDLRNWLKQRVKTVGDPHLDTLLNRNQFFNYYYATGKTIDTEETVFCTSRSSRYYVSAAYWDRDSLLWSLPALLETDASKAREALDYVFTRQLKNVGVHSRYIDGTVLEPGFELDELCAPLLALDQYLTKTSDWNYLDQPHVRRALFSYEERFEPWRHADIELYATFLMPTDDMHRYPYLTYNNVLVWRTFRILSGLFTKLAVPEKGDLLEKRAEAVRQAIWQHCVKEIEGTDKFVWSTDLNGHFDFYDEPPGSLTLLAHHGFCADDEPIFRNTLEHLYSPAFAHYFGDSEFAELGCTHANHPWVLAICNSLLNGRYERAVDMLKRTSMDNFIACESIHEETGEWATGAHFATCAGFLVYALLNANKEAGV